VFDGLPTGIVLQCIAIFGKCNVTGVVIVLVCKLNADQFHMMSRNSNCSVGYRMSHINIAFVIYDKGSYFIPASLLAVIQCKIVHIFRDIFQFFTYDFGLDAFFICDYIFVSLLSIDDLLLLVYSLYCLTSFTGVLCNLVVVSI